MKYLALLLIFGFGLSGFGQTIKSLGYNTTNGQVVANTGTNVLTFTNNLRFNSGDLQFNAAQIVGNGLSIDFDDGAVSGGPITLDTNASIAFQGASAASTRANLGFSTNLNTLWTATNASNAANSIGAITATNAAATVTTFSSSNISNNITLTNVSTNTLQGNITYRVFIYSAAYSDGTNGWQIRNNVSAVPNISISLAPTRALNGGNWGMGGAITDINNTVSLATSAGQLYIYANTYIFRHTNNVTLNVQFAQNTSGATYSAVSGTIVIEPIAW